MGVTLVASRPDRGHEAFVVIKRPHAALLKDAGARQRFHHEGAVATAVVHPNLVQTILAGEDQWGPYLISEYVHGATLMDLIDRAAVKGTLLSWSFVAEVGAEVLRGLAALHSAIDPKGRPMHAVHRDVSPQNILVLLDGRVKVADFGIAKSSLSSVCTDATFLLGKLAYLAPEYLTQKATGPHLDVYAASVTLWTALAGRTPFPGATERAILQRILQDGLPDLTQARPDVPSDLSALLKLAAHEDPTMRPNAAEFAEALHAVLSAPGPEGRSSEPQTFVEQGRAHVRAVVDTLAGTDLRLRLNSFLEKAHNLQGVQ